MLFDLCNAAQTFQRFIDKVLQGLTFAYANILIASASEEEHLQHVDMVFQCLANMVLQSTLISVYSALLLRIFR